MTKSDSRYLEDPQAAVLLDSHPVPRRALFLDRDGVINLDHAYVHTSDRTEWLPGIFDLCATAIAGGFLPVVVTNQAGIARGLYNESEFITYTHWVHEAFRLRGVPLLATYYCPHHPDAGKGSLLVHCGCRKPAPGMILDAATRYGIILAQSWLIGNRASDIDAGNAAGVGRSILLEDASNAEVVTGSVDRVESLEAARLLLAELVSP